MTDVIHISTKGYTDCEEGVLDGINTKIWSEQCTMCQHNPTKKEFLNSCSVYPEGIPMDIWLNKRACEFREY